MIYFMRASGTDWVKIGYTKDDASLQRRKATLQTGQPWKLEILRTIEDAGQWMEGWFHQEFRELRHHGEWFTYSPDMMDVIPDAAAFIRGHGGMMERKALEKLIASLVDVLDTLTPDPESEPDLDGEPERDDEPDNEADLEPEVDDEPDADGYILIPRSERAETATPFNAFDIEDAEPSLVSVDE